MDVRKTIAELTSQLSEIHYDSDTENILLKDCIKDDVHHFSEQFNEVIQSKLRKVTDVISLPDHEYAGKLISRKSTYHSSDSDSDSSEDFSYSKRSDGNEEDGDVDCKSPSHFGDVNSSETQESKEIYSKSCNKDKLKEGLLDFNIYSDGSKNICDVKKGAAIRNQLRIWESLLECRIKLQKALVASNSLPTIESFSAVRVQLNSQNQQKLNKCKKSLFLLLHKMKELQEEMKKQEYVKHDVMNSGELNEDISSNESELEENKGDCQPASKKKKLNDYSFLLRNNHAKFTQFQNATIQKWNDKTKVSSGKMANSNFSAFDHSTLKQIEQIMTDKERLINRTRIKRNDSLGSTIKSQGEVHKDSQEVALNPEIFDDTDFYHKLLRDYIERKSVDVTNLSQTERQMIELQKLRSKMKKNIDTKSTKGRKLRYVVIPKLVNFMAPDSYSTWNEQAETELYNSLFGKMTSDIV